MKYIFIEPVSYIFSNVISLSIPTLVSILRKNGHEVEFFNLNNEILFSCFDKTIYENLIEKRNKILNNKNIQNAPSIIQKILKKGLDYCIQRKKIYNFSSIGLALKILKNKKYFLNKIFAEYAYKTIKHTLNEIGYLDTLLTIELSPNTETHQAFFEGDSFSLDIDNFIYYFENKLSPIDEFIENKAEEIINQNPDCIGISIGFEHYLLHGLLLAYKIKKKSNIHINIGGAFFNDFHKRIKNLNRLFGTFFDTISIDDNTCTVTDILKYINKEINIEDVSNILYLKNGNVQQSNSTTAIDFKNLPQPIFIGVSSKNYLTPEIILPIQSSTSCYWAKCIYCYCSGNSSSIYQTKPPEQITNEINTLSKLHNTKYFEFWDNSLHPAYLSKLADEILKNKLDVRFSIYARFEEEFDYKLLKKLKKAGCIKIHWGLDSANQRILDYINKGINLATTKRILKDAKKAGIYNFVYVILGLPTETKEEINITYNYLKENQKNINKLNIVPQIVFPPTAIISSNRGKYRKLIYITMEERLKIKNKIMEKFLNIQKRDLYNFTEDFIAPMFLYIDHYGAGFKSYLYSYMYDFILSHKKLLNIYLKYKLKQIK